jgi:3-hydroxy-3-methylglutaryl CoA synthase
MVWLLEPSSLEEAGVVEVGIVGDDHDPASLSVGSLHQLLRKGAERLLVEAVIFLTENEPLPFKPTASK